MPSQTVGNVHVSVPLTNLARLYRPDTTGLIADMVCPPLPVVHENDLYYTWDQGPFFDVGVDDLVADREAARRVEYDHSTSSYTAVKRALAWDISDRELANADSQLRLEMVKQEGTLGRLLQTKELRVANLLRSTFNGGGIATSMAATAGTKWDSVASTTYLSVFKDVLAGRTAMRQAIGQAPNVIVLPAVVVENLMQTPFFTDAMKYTMGAPAGPDAQPLYTNYPLLPSTLWGMKPLVPGAIYNTAKEGQTESNSDIWGDSVRLLYVTPGPAIEEPSVAYSIQSRPLTTRFWRDEQRETNAYEVGYVGVEQVVAPFAGYEIFGTQ